MGALGLGEAGTHVAAKLTTVEWHCGMLLWQADQYIRTPTGDLFVKESQRKGILPEILSVGGVGGRTIIVSRLIVSRRFVRGPFSTFHVHHHGHRHVHRHCSADPQ